MLSWVEVITLTAGALLSIELVLLGISLLRRKDK